MRISNSHQTMRIKSSLPQPQPQPQLEPELEQEPEQVITKVTEILQEVERLGSDESVEYLVCKKRVLCQLINGTHNALTKKYLRNIIQSIRKPDNYNPELKLYIDDLLYLVYREYIKCQYDRDSVLEQLDTILSNKSGMCQNLLTILESIYDTNFDVSQFVECTLEIADLNEKYAMLESKVQDIQLVIDNLLTHSVEGTGQDSELICLLDM